MGITYPLQSMLPIARQSEELSDLRRTSAKLVETPSGAAQPSSDPPAMLVSGPPQIASEGGARPPAGAPASALGVRTGSLDRPLPAGGSADVVAATQEAPPDLAQPEGTPRATGNQSHRQVRARRLRRMLARPAPPKSAGAQVDAFISSILPSK